jgi:hypothetical protein
VRDAVVVAHVANAATWSSVSAWFHSWTWPIAPLKYAVWPDIEPMYVLPTACQTEDTERAACRFPFR